MTRAALLHFMRSENTPPGLIYVRVRPMWIRYSNFSVDPPEIVEFDPRTWRG